MAMANTMADRDGLIWYDGKMVPWRDATTHVLTHTLHYGMGVFEGVRAYKTARGPAVFRLREHTQRLLDSAKILGMPAPYSADEINAHNVEDRDVLPLERSDLQHVGAHEVYAQGVATARGEVVAVQMPENFGS